MSPVPSHRPSTAVATAPAEFGFIACASRYWTQALDFQGRATRRDFLVALVMNTLATAILVAISPVLAKVYGLVTIIPNLSQFCRRCHDAGRSATPLIGGMVLLMLAMMFSGRLAFLPAIALVGLMAYVLWVLWLTPGDPSVNRYGPDPRV